MMEGAQVEGFTAMMLSLQLPRLSPTLVPLGTPPPVKERLLLSSAKLLMKLPGDGQVLLMALMLGDIALLGNKTPAPIAPQVLNSPVLLANNTMVAVPSKLHGTTTTDSVEEQ